MAQGSGSARQVTVLGLSLLLCLLLQAGIAESAVYAVGDRGGWTFNTVAWTNGKRFRAGDVLVFKYNPGVHNVVAVDAAGYNGCKTTRGSKVFKSGNDRFTLRKGRNYFICNVVGHCEAGMKVAITAV
ncbi:chemocyanin-like [Typha angustifolia]|uniref:chemocyanin-like n=1 Tax=Typha angustifolia TaxID=59011 RepID=UPI003C2B612D